MATPHYTPPELAKVLAKYVPSEARLILEPSAGKGELIVALNARQRRKISVVCIDQSQEALDILTARLAPELGRRLVQANADFLTWRYRRMGFHDAQFDCVLMNPPFSARKENWKKLNVADLKSLGVTDAISGPQEVQFLIRAIRLLREGGKLVAIVPSSVVAAQSSSWFREVLFLNGHIRVVHQLPRSIFPGTETECYILVFEKSPGRVVRLLNHDLSNPDEIKISIKNLNSEFRLDFGRVTAELAIKKLEKNTGKLGWKRMEEIAIVTRGRAKTPFRRKRAIHTTNFFDGVWKTSSGETYLKSASQGDTLMADDLLIKRVGRSSAASMGLYKSVFGLRISDCVFRIRLMDPRSMPTLLLAFRVMMATDWAKSLLERGAGVTYISEADLRKFPIPMNLISMYPTRVAKYTDALRRSDLKKMKNIEHQTFLDLSRHNIEVFTKK